MSQRERQPILGPFGDSPDPEAVVRRRFSAGKVNFEAVYKPLVDAWALYDNSNGEPILLSWGEK